MKKHTIEITRIPNSPEGTGIFKPELILRNHKQEALDYCLSQGWIFIECYITDKFEPYTDGQYREMFWSGGKKTTSNEVRFGDLARYLYIYYNDHNSLLAENIELKNILKELNEKYNVASN